MHFPYIAFFIMSSISLRFRATRPKMAPISNIVRMGNGRPKTQRDLTLDLPAILFRTKKKKYDGKGKRLCHVWILVSKDAVAPSSVSIFLLFFFYLFII